jgi:hypothetical protein
MGNSLPAKLIYYWIFILGGIMFAYLLKLTTNGKDVIILLVVLSLVYWGMEFLRFRGRQKRGEQGDGNGKANNSKAKKR